MTQLNEQKVKQLSNEIDKGKTAEKFYNQFVEPFVEEKRKMIFDAFMDTAPTDIENLAELRRMISIVNIFDYEIRAFMQTGRMAEMSINEMEKH